MDNTLKAPERKSKSAQTGLFLTLIFAFYIGITYGFGLDLFSLVIPDMRADLGFDYTEAGILSAAARAGFLCGGLIAAYCLRWLNHGQLIALSAAITVGCLVLMGTVQSTGVVRALLFCTGLSAATVYIPMVVVVGTYVQASNRGKSFAIISSGQSWFVFANSLVAPWFLLSGDWRSLWFAVGAASAIILIATYIPLAFGPVACSKKSTYPRREPRRRQTL